MSNYFTRRDEAADKEKQVFTFRNWSLVVWFKGLKGPGQMRLGGVLLSCLATCLVLIAVSTSYWVKRFVRGIFVYRGLWMDCQLRTCAPIKQMPSYIVFSILFMLTSVVTCYTTVISGTFCLTDLPRNKRLSMGTLTITLCTVSGFSGAIGLFNFMRSSTLEPNTFLSWSLAPGWFSVILVSMAGVCHFVAKNWEEEEIAEERLAAVPLVRI